jgi:hypothetical protein
MRAASRGHNTTRATIAGKGRCAEMASCETCGTYLKEKLAAAHECDEIWDITYFPDDEEGGEPRRSVPRNYFCSPECAIEGLRNGVPRKATKEKIRRDDELREKGESDGEEVA